MRAIATTLGALAAAAAFGLVVAAVDAAPRGQPPVADVRSDPAHGP